MPRRTGTTTKEYLSTISLPTHGGRYTVIPHAFIIDNALAELKANGLTVNTELYRCSIDGNVATGIYHINNENDKELGMIFAWSNSYDKTMRFKCAVGAYVYTSKNLILKKDIGSWGRKHTGTADSEALDTIKNQILNATDNFNRIIKDKDKMKTITVSTQKGAEIMGRLFLEKELVTSEQMGIVKSQLKEPMFDYISPVDSLWVFYNHISYALQKAHPKTWMDQQRLINWFLCEEFGINALETNSEETPIIHVMPLPPEFQEKSWVERIEEASASIQTATIDFEKPKKSDTFDITVSNVNPNLQDFDL
jgi:hypothetical protein